MSRFEELKRKIAAREEVLTTNLGNIGWSGIIEVISRFPFDAVVLDLEHGTLSVESAETLLRTCRLCDLPGIVRIPDCIPHLISKTLDMGADGIIIPRVESISQVETAIRAMRYFPRGRKGCGGFSNSAVRTRGVSENITIIAFFLFRWNRRRDCLFFLKSSENIKVRFQECS